MGEPGDLAERYYDALGEHVANASAGQCVETAADADDAIVRPTNDHCVAEYRTGFPSAAHHHDSPAAAHRVAGGAARRDSIAEAAECNHDRAANREFATTAARGAIDTGQQPTDRNASTQSHNDGAANREFTAARCAIGAGRQPAASTGALDVDASAE